LRAVCDLSALGERQITSSTAMCCRPMAARATAAITGGFVALSQCLTPS
jgi:ribonuclease PH